ncbi:aminopeptidase N [Propionicimonas sp.]|uniref:aminopeptidase N n=1 Tax=Propionicimonas sp. TaxID=1955623 RepID=UPI0039E5DECB
MYAANITRAEASARSGQIAVHSYDVIVDLSGRVPDAQAYDPAATFVSTSTVRFTSRGGDSWINLIAERLLEATLDGVALPEDALADHRLAFTTEPGEHELTVSALCSYSRTGEGLHRFVDPVDGLVYCYTQFETADARRMYACFEQPDLKAIFALTVVAPGEWTVLSNSAEVTPVLLEDGLARWHFAPTPPISTYVTALVAGSFHVVRDSYAGAAREIPLSLACRASVAPYLDTERILATTKAGFAVFEEHFGLPYPFEDYAQVFVPEFNAGAMENAGCVTIRDEYLYRSRVTNAAYETRDNTILHELAHMWFGDLVTMTWWDDLWLNESFAEWASHFCQAEIRAAGADRDDPWAIFANSRKNWAYRQDQLPSTHPVAADMVDLAAVELNFDGITYAKGASVLRQLVAFVGQDAFLTGVRAYFARHAWGNTRLPDLLAALTEASGRDLSHFAAEWLQTAGVNTIWAEFAVDDGGAFSRFAIRQVAPAAWPTLRHHRLAVGLYEEQDGCLVRVHRAEVDIAGELTELPELIGQRRPAVILLNDDDLTYTKIRLDPASMAAVVKGIGTLTSPLTRAVCWGASWDMCRDAELPASDFVTLALSGAGVETDITAVQGILGQCRTAIDYYTPRADRSDLNDRFVTGVARLLKDAAPGSDHQLAFARSLAAAADTGSVVGVLSAWLSGEEAPTGLAVDTDLRWYTLSQLARVGAIGDAEIDAELARDATARGAEQAAGVRAAQPTEAAKAEAWRLACEAADTPNETHFQVCTHFWQLGQEEVLRPYVERYLEVARAISDGTDGWAERSSTIRQHVLNRLFPSPLADRDTLSVIDGWLREAPLSSYVLRQVSERRDDAERALRCQEAAQR